jgi:hypothetical protein
MIISGEMELTKTLVYKGIKSEKVENIFKDPLKANKKQNILFTKNILYKEKKMSVSFYTTLTCINLVIHYWAGIVAGR